MYNEQSMEREVTESTSMIESLVEQLLEDYMACKTKLITKCEEIKALKEELGKADDSEDMSISTKLEEILDYKNQVMSTLMQIMSSGM